LLGVVALRWKPDTDPKEGIRMTKRSAIVMAAGLVAALMAGAMALSFGLSGSGTAQAEGKAPEPIVRTIHRTVTIEKDAKPEEQQVQVVRVASAPASGDVSGSDDTYEDEGDDAYEHESESSEDGEHETEGSDDSVSDRSSEDGGEHEDD